MTWPLALSDLAWPSLTRRSPPHLFGPLSFPMLHFDLLKFIVCCLFIHRCFLHADAFPVDDSLQMILHLENVLYIIQRNNFFFFHKTRHSMSSYRPSIPATSLYNQHLYQRWRRSDAEGLLLLLLPCWGSSHGGHGGASGPSPARPTPGGAVITVTFHHALYHPSFHISLSLSLSLSHQIITPPLCSFLPSLSGLFFFFARFLKPLRDVAGVNWIFLFPPFWEQRGEELLSQSLQEITVRTIKAHYLSRSIIFICWAVEKIWRILHESNVSSLQQKQTAGIYDEYPLRWLNIHTSVITRRNGDVFWTSTNRRQTVRNQNKE